MDESENADSTSSSISSEDMDTDSVSSAASWDSIDGPLYDMSSLKAHLPRRNGLSKFFAGKSQSFGSLAEVKCLGDLPKPNRKNPKGAYPPRVSRGAISKRPPKASFACKMAKKGLRGTL